MKKTINLQDFIDSFKKFDRDYYSYKGYVALFNYLENLEEDTGEEIELDVIALCSDFTEYKSIEEIKKDYPEIESIEDLIEKTTVIEIEGTKRLIIQAF
jgi:hypothetical protein